MLSTNKNYTIRINELQAFLKENREKLGWTLKQLNRIIKTIKRKDTTKEMRNVLYKECLKKINTISIKVSKFNHLNMDDRIIIELLHTSGFSNTVISDFLSRNRTTIYREINKNNIIYEDLNSLKSYKKGNQYINYYSANVAQDTYIRKRKKCRKKFILEKYPDLAIAVKKLLEEGIYKEKSKSTLSPDTIAYMSKNGNIKEITNTIGKDAIYNAVHNNIGGLTINSLPYKMRYYKPNKKTESAKTTNKEGRISIEDMPDNIKKNLTITHFQGDSVVGKRKGTANTLLTFANPSNQFLIAHKSKDKTAKSTVETLDKIEQSISNFGDIMKTILLDNGVEFSNIKGMSESVHNRKESRFDIYFAHAYSSYERGCNENKNRMIRKFIPKGAKIENYTDEDIFKITAIINNTPRKKLGYKTPLEMYREQLISAKIDTKFLEKYKINFSEYITA